MADATTDEQLLGAADAESFARFYRRHVARVLAYFARRTHDPELAADLCAETFAAALAARSRYRPERGAAVAWLFGIAAKKLADAQRRGYVEQRARRRLGMERLDPSAGDLAWIERLGEPATARLLLDGLPSEQREAVAARVLGERSYADIAAELDVSQTVVRKRVSRGLAGMRQRLGVRR